MKNQTESQNTENWGGKAFNEYANNAFTRDREQRANALFTNSVDTVLQNKEMANSPKMQYDNYVLRDGDKNPSMSPLEYQSYKAMMNSEFYKQSSNLSQSLPIAGLAFTGVAGAGYLSSLNLSARTIVGANAVIGGGAKAYTNIVDKGELRLPSVLFAAGTSAVGGQLGASYGFIRNGAISAGFSVVDTAYNNYFYREDEKYLYNAGLNFAGGSLGKYVDGRITTSLQIKSLPITYSNVSNFSLKAPVAGGITGAVISNVPPVVFRERKPE